MTISSRTSYDNRGLAYNVTRILTPESTLDLEAYEQYSPLFLSTTFALAYGLSFASITSVIVHTALYFRKQIYVQTRRALSEQPDIHARLMARYPQVPDWWYAVIFGTSKAVMFDRDISDPDLSVVMFVFGVISIEVWNTQMPVWALVLALLIGENPQPHLHLPLFTL